MHLVFDIFQGMGIGAAVGMRPFLPTLAVGGLAAADVQIDFNGTGYKFLEQAVFLLVILVCAVALALIERRPADGPLRRRSLATIVLGCSLVLGALLFAGSLARGHYAAWPGWIGGALCAALGLAATQPLLARVRSRLDPSAAAGLPLYTEAAAVLTAVLSVVVPPLGLIAVGLLLWLLVADRRRAGQKYAGLRILR